MTKNPVTNALAAIIYIVGVALLINFMGRAPEESIENGKILIPIAMLSLFVLSAAIMGYLFCFTPLQLYLDGHKKEATKLFLETVGTFAAITVILFSTLVYLSA